ncbi:hypothetical protein K466DRAFT_496126 [Polyporus arcularius HHB13444]|uniref:Uncharacterized protein n=1 Tax=Polyporus arcularius HHB13444 TaxID=1314778 RepID=A0A5C3P6U2_9APHY|nr:hypothetical protein K466DRAFT_496126 [Polyporus arcularius HHB13444]
MPTFGRDRIRRFWNDVSARKKLAARDYEAFLMTIIPAYEGLLPLADEENVMDLLFELANWHALAKLRAHHEITLDNLGSATRHLYAAMRQFDTEVCPNYDTRETPSEAQARVRRDQARDPDKAADTGTKAKPFNVLNTYKYHVLGDYCEYIKRCGTSDNWTTQVVSISHYLGV